MADEKPNLEKLQKFVEAAITNPLHPIYRLGYARSQMLQNYAINVMTLESVKPQKWFEDYPEYTRKLTEVMALCEAIEPEKPAAPVTEATPMMVKCPACGKEFAVPAKGD